MRFALLHSPVVGPTTWRWVAETLRQADQQVVVPDLIEAVASGNPLIYARAAIRALSGDEILLVGHSGAGAILPLVAHGLVHKPRRTIFVDAGLPPCQGSFTAAGDFVGKPRELSNDGVLPIWSRWWRPGLFESLIPDDGRRDLIERELPEVPLRVYETQIAVPDRWCATSGAYLLLSEGYRADAERATELGWPVVERLGNHLDIVNDAEEIAEILVELA